MSNDISCIPFSKKKVVSILDNAARLLSEVAEFSSRHSNEFSAAVKDLSDLSGHVIEAKDFDKRLDEIELKMIRVQDEASEILRLAGIEAGESDA